MEKEECSICLEPFGGSPLWTLDCLHKYHVSCVKNLEKCPLCRADISEVSTLIVEGPMWTGLKGLGKERQEHRYDLDRFAFYKNIGYVFQLREAFCLGLHCGNGNTIPNKKYAIKGQDIYYPNWSTGILRTTAEEIPYYWMKLDKIVGDTLYLVVKK